MNRTSPSLVRHHRTLAALAVASAVLAGCVSPKGDPEATTTVVLAIMTVPSDVSCIEVKVTGAQTSTQLFSVTPGTSTTLTVEGVASGPVSISERAFAVTCSQVTPATPPTWISEAPATVTLIPGAVVDVTLVLRPAGQVRINNDFQSGAASTFTLSPAALSFGNVNVGASLSLTVTVTNTGTTSALVPPASIPVSPTDPMPQFSMVSGAPMACSATTTLAPGAGCTIQVAFSPTSPGTKTSTLSLLGLAGSVSLSGMGVTSGPGVSVSPATLSFGSITVGGTSPAQTVTVANTGSSPMAPPSPSISAGSDPVPQFALSTAGATMPGACQTITSLAPGSSCTVLLVFSPTSAGAKSATLSFGTPPLANVALSGTGVATMPGFSATPGMLSFGSVNVGASSAVQTITVTNTGTASGTLGTPAFSAGSDPTPQFRLGTGPGTPSGSCATVASLAPGATCTVVVSFAPTSAGIKNANLTFGTPALLTVPLNGTGVATMPAFSVSPATLGFGSINVGATAPAQTLTVTNTGTAAGNLGAPSITGGSDPTPQFSVAGGSCATLASIAPGATCTVLVAFAPTSAGIKNATLSFGTPPTISVPLNGTGVTPPATFSTTPTTLAFGNLAVGSTAGAQMAVTIRNTGTTAATVPAIALAGTNANQFVLTNTGLGSCGALTAPLAANGTCTVQIRFAPTSLGAKTASLNVGSPVVATTALSGTGI